MTTTEPNAGEQKRGRHAKTHDEDRLGDPADLDREPAHAATRTDDRPDDEPEARADDETRADDEARDDAQDEVAPGDEPAAVDEPQARHEARDEAASEEEPAADDAPDEPAAAEAAATGSDNRTRDEATDEATDEKAHPAEPRREPARQQVQEEPARTSSRHAIAHHPAGASLLTAAGLVTGLALAPLLFEQLRFEVAVRAADAARSAAAPWPAGGEPWFWPGWIATTATVVAVAVLVVAAVGIRLPDVVILGTAVVLGIATARAAWSTLAVLNAHLWELIPLCLLCLLALGSAVGVVFRWRSGESPATGAGTGEVVGVTIGSWLLVVLLLLGGSAIASSAQTHAFGNVTSPPQDLAGLLSVRSADAPELHDLRGAWVAQVGAAQVADDAAATAFAVRHHDWTTRFPTLLARGDDTGAPELDDTWWLSLANQRFASKDAAAAWCSSNGVTDCTPRLISD